MTTFQLVYLGVAFADYSWCRDEIEAIAAYAEPLKVDAGGSP